MDKQQINRSLQKETKAGDHQEILKENNHVKNKIKTTNRSPKINSKSAWKTIRAIFYIKRTTPKGRIKIFLEWGGGIIFRTTPSCKHFFRYFFNHVLTQKGDSLFADGLQSLFNFNILRWQPTNWKKRNLQSGSKSTNHCSRTLPFDTSELIFFVFWDVQCDDWRQWKAKPFLQF